MNRVIFESKLELITFTLDGHLLHTHKTTFAQRHSLETWPDFDSAKRPLRAAMSNGDKRKNNQRATAARWCVRPAFGYLTSRQPLKRIHGHG